MKAIKDMKTFPRYLTACLCFMISGFVDGVELKIYSGGPFEAAFHEIAKDFERSSGNKLSIEYGTAPQLQKKLAENAPGDLLLTATKLMSQPENRIKLVDGTMALLGKGGVGIMLQKDAVVPLMNNPQNFQDVVLKADKLIYNKASTGLYMDQLFQKIGLVDQLEKKTERFVNGDDTIARVARGSGNEIGFGAIAEIQLNLSKGVKYAGPLPDAYQNYTEYSGAVMKSSIHPKETQQLIDFLQSPRVKEVFKRTGID
jgi:molybdate transport system substrate-binding protein